MKILCKINHDMNTIDWGDDDDDDALLCTVDWYVVLISSAGVSWNNDQCSYSLLSFTNIVG